METIKKCLRELHSKDYKRSKNKTLGCLFRAQILFQIAQKYRYKAKIMRYHVKGDKGKPIDTRIPLILDRRKLPSHVVLQIDNDIPLILDPNIGKIMPKVEYDKKLREETKNDIESEEYNEKIDDKELRKRISDYHLEICSREFENNAQP